MMGNKEFHISEPCKKTVLEKLKEYLAKYGLDQKLLLAGQK
jgi:hypothetical protein